MAERHDEHAEPAGHEERVGTPAYHGDIADAYAPPVPPSKASRSWFMIGVLSLLAVCVLVFVIALLVR